MSGDAKRLEQLWGGGFGDEYSERNASASHGREVFWTQLLEQLDPTSALEVGSNVGGNIKWIVPSVRGPVVGLDINHGALRRMRESIPDARPVVGAARALPFADATFDLVFTIGVLIHQPPESLPVVMDEIVRCSKRFVLCAEYRADEEVEVNYRGLDGALWKRDYGAEYLRRYPDLELIDQGFLPKGEGSWDDVTWWTMRRRA